MLPQHRGAIHRPSGMHPCCVIQSSACYRTAVLSQRSLARAGRLQRMDQQVRRVPVITSNLSEKIYKSRAAGGCELTQSSASRSRNVAHPPSPGAAHTPRPMHPARSSIATCRRHHASRLQTQAICQQGLEITMNGGLLLQPQIACGLAAHAFHRRARILRLDVWVFLHARRWDG